jgi:FkbM family methyltransferase
MLEMIKQRLKSDFRIKVPSKILGILRKNKMVVADVGAAGGTEDHWAPLHDCVRFVTFEPDHRTQDTVEQGDSENIVFGKALGKDKGQKKIYLANFSDASSLYPLNQEALKDFANEEGHRVVGSDSVDVDTLDNCLSAYPDLHLDFLKVDVEGSDLDVLIGAKEVLSKDVMGLKVEVSFLERYVGAPLFGEVDKYLKSLDFDLFSLNTQSWLRKNRLYSISSNPQVIWGDAVYFLKKDVFIERLSEKTTDLAEAYLSKFISLLLLYRLHDYALEILDDEMVVKNVKPELILALKASLKKSMGNGFYLILKALFFALIGFVGFFVFLPIKKLRNKMIFFIKKRVSLLGYYIFKAGAKSGPYNSCVSDVQLFL